MKRKPRSLDIFSLSFLDIISCGFGAVVMLVLISRNGDAPAGDNAVAIQELLSRIFASETQVEILTREVREAEEEKNTRDQTAARLRQDEKTLRQALQADQQRLGKMANDLEGLAMVRETLQRASIRPATAKKRDEEVGGIPVDSDYVVFIVDTSGSMRTIWERVIRELENIINIHPEIKGFQIMNDNGLHLLSAYTGRWIPDTPDRRKSAIRLLRNWSGISNSSPVEGLENALKNYVRPGKKVSIYIFGDEYTGGSFDPVLQTLDRLNANPRSGKPLARVHGVGFFTEYSSASFPTLMREVTRRNNGTFVALPP